MPESPQGLTPHRKGCFISPVLVQAAILVSFHDLWRGSQPRRSRREQRHHNLMAERVLWQEHAIQDGSPESEILKRPLVPDRGYRRVPDTPGIGVELNLAALEQLPHSYRDIETALHDDGSVADK